MKSFSELNEMEQLTKLMDKTITEDYPFLNYFCIYFTSLFDNKI